MRFRLASVEARNCSAGCAKIIIAEGVIEEDTPQAFVDFINSAAVDRSVLDVVLLSSPGGHVAASMELGATLREMGAEVVVARSFRTAGREMTAAGQCMSACVYALMGGATRIVPPHSSVGIHRMSRPEAGGAGREMRAPTRTFASKDLVGALADYAAQMGVNPEVIRRAEGISPDDIRILTDAEMRRWRLAR